MIGNIDSSYRKYPSYRNSGMEWLGEVPEHWQVRRLKHLALVIPSNVDKKSIEGQEQVRLCNYVDVYYNEKIDEDINFQSATATADQVAKFELRKNDVLVTKDSESWDDIAVPAVVDKDLSSVLCGYHLAIIRPGPDLHGPFLMRLFSAHGPRDQFHVASNGITRFGLSGSAIRTGVFAVPPVAEQRLIAAFLDRETARIDALIARKERLTQLLNEKRAAMITKAVTKGLDPEAPMKDSGVQWLGDVPVHWDVRMIKRIAYMKSGTAITSHSIKPVGDYPVFGGNGVRGFTDSFTHEGTYPLIGRQGALCGCINLANGRFWASEHAVVATPAAEVDAYWLANLLDSMSLNRYSVSAAQPGLAIDRIGKLRAPYPPAEEQIAISKFLKGGAGRADRLIQKVMSGIELLTELRTALISAAVTGKIDVRNEVA